MFYYDLSAFNTLNLRLSSLDVHPATRLVVWFLLLVAVQGMDEVMLGVVFVLLPILPLRVLRRGGRLVWRTRWLLLSLFVIFSWGVAGEPLWIGAVAPTREGLLEALIHLGRLILVLMVVAAFLEEMLIPDLLSATHTLFKPLRRIGFDPDRGVIRLRLVLRYVETLPSPRDWRSLLDVPALSESEWVEIDHQRFRFLDIAITLIAVVATCLFVFNRH